MNIMEVKIKKNKSSVFLLPMLGINLNLFKNFYNVYNQSVYEKNNEDRKIYIVYKTENINQEILNSISKSVYYLDNKDIDSFTIIRYRVPSIYLNDFKLFCNGKYNSFSKEYKNLLLKCYSINKVEFEKILNTLPKTKQELAEKFNVNIEDIKEVYSIPDEIEETFSISNNYKLKL